MSDRALLCLVTAPAEAAPQLARTMVEARLCACVNLLPAVQSIYRWQDAVEESHETLLLIKTAAHRFEELRRMVVQHHPYELPEIVAVNIADAHAPYLQWLLQESSPPLSSASP